MCDPVTATALIAGGSLIYQDVARKKANKQANDAEMKQDKDEYKAKKKIKKEKEASAAAALEGERKNQQREALFKKSGFRSTFGTSGGSLGLTGPPKTGMKKLLGG